MVKFIKTKLNLLYRLSQPRFKNETKERFHQYIDLVNNCANGNEYEYSKSLIGIVVEYLNYKQAINSIEFETSDQNNSHIENIYNNLLKMIKQDCSDNKEVVIPINKYPILLNPWEKQRIITNFININENNVFDGKKHSNNIHNHYLKPMNIVVCNNGNHSQLSARYKNSGETIIKKIIDYSNLYEMFSFNGEDYINITTNEIIKFDNYDNEIIFYSGVIFELGRFILNREDCPSDNTL